MTPLGDMPSKKTSDINMIKIGMQRLMRRDRALNWRGAAASSSHAPTVPGLVHHSWGFFRQARAIRQGSGAGRLGPGRTVPPPFPLRRGRAACPAKG